jgi:hypothetical protein
MREATLKEVKEFFGENSNTRFAQEWKVLSDEEKEYFKTAVAAANDNN